MHQRRAGESPVRHRGPEFGGDVFFPDDFAGRGLETEQVAPAAEGEDLAAADGGSGGGPAFEILVAQFGRVAVFPHFFAGQGIETEDRVLLALVAQGIEPAVGHAHGREACAHGRLPQNRGAVARKAGGDTFVGNAVAQRSAPLRPIGGLGCSGEGEKKKGEGAHG